MGLSAGKNSAAPQLQTSIMIDRGYGELIPSTAAQSLVQV